MTLDNDRFRWTGASVGTRFYTLEVTEDEKKKILKDQWIVYKLTNLINTMSLEGKTSNIWIREVLGGLIQTTEQGKCTS